VAQDTLENRGSVDTEDGRSVTSRCARFVEWRHGCSRFACEKVRPARSHRHERSPPTELVADAERRAANPLGSVCYERGRRGKRFGGSGGTLPLALTCSLAPRPRGTERRNGASGASARARGSRPRPQPSCPPHGPPARRLACLSFLRAAVAAYKGAFVDCERRLFSETPDRRQALAQQARCGNAERVA